MKGGGQILWNAIAFCETSKISWQTGKLRMNEDLDNHVKNQIFHLGQRSAENNHNNHNNQAQTSVWQVSGLSWSSPHLRGGDKGLLRGILSGGVWNGFLHSFVRGEIVPCRLCGGPVVMDICFGSALILPLFTFVRVLIFMIFCFVIGVLGLGVCFGMGGYLHLLALVGLLLGLLRLMMLLVLGWRDCWVLILRVFVESGFFLINFLIVLLLLMFLIILMCGLMAVLFLMSCRVLWLVGALFTLLSLVLVGLVKGGVIRSCCLLANSVLSVVSCLTRSAVLFSP